MNARTILERRLAASIAAENTLREIGELQAADAITSLRRGYTAAITQCKQFHKDAMELRKQLDKAVGK